MAITAWSMVRFVHVIAAMMWVGGQLTLSGVVLPAVRAELRPELRGPVVLRTARRFAALANVVILPTLIVSGVALAWHRGVTLSTFSTGGYGRLLGIKIALFVVSVGLAAVHGIFAARSPRNARALAVAGLCSSVLIVVFATALVP